MGKKMKGVTNDELLEQLRRGEGVTVDPDAERVAALNRIADGLLACAKALELLAGASAPAKGRPSKPSGRRK